MLFNSYTFIFIFLPITWLIFQTLKKHPNQNATIYWLVVASLFFYAWWNPIYLCLIIASIASNYSIGQLIERHLHNKKITRYVLIFGITLNLAALAYFKYANFFVDNLNTIFSAELTLERIILPLAISFFTFQQITYLVDTAKGLCSEHDFSHYCLYVTFFPQLIAGPIVHHKEMLPQFFMRKSRSIQYSDLAVGLSIFSIGLFKKVVIADSLAPYANEVFFMAEQGVAISQADAWIGAMAYTFQLYFDFSGYADMAIGIARMFGILLPLNFHSPYKSRNIIEFWRRWHMTLSRFLRDYLYIPLGGNRKGETRRYINLFITMLLGGLWHGAGWTFIIWGALHGAFLTINHLWNKVIQARSFHLNIPGLQYLSHLLTLLCVVIAWVIFRAADINSALVILSAMSGLNDASLLQNTQKITLAFSIIAALLAWVLFMPNTQEIFKNYRPAFDFKKSEVSNKRLVWRPTFGWNITFSALLIFSILNLSKLSEFLYFQF